jgi:predicted ribosome quality control (RQC) complex YloA/Tae2 family protein
MIASYYTLKAWVDERRRHLVGRTVAEAFSQERDELTIVVADGDAASMIRVSTRRAFVFIYSVEGYNRARRNTASLFPEVAGLRIEELSIAERDRIIFVQLEGGLSLRMHLFGPRPNIFLTGEDHLIRDAFSAAAKWVGQEAPQPRPAPDVADLDAFTDRWDAGRKTLPAAVSRAVPLFDEQLAAEAVRRSGIEEKAPGECTPEDLAVVFRGVRAVRTELERPAARIYWRGKRPSRFALVRLAPETEERVERMDSIDDGVRVFVRRRLATARFEERFTPVEKALVEAAGHYRKSASQILEQLSNESRAERYEHWAHLLMASPVDKAAGRDSVVLDDIVTGAGEIEIPLDPRRSLVQNAERYYDRARSTRQAREVAESRLVEMEQAAVLAEELLTELRRIGDPRALEAFLEERSDVLARFLRRQATERDLIPFRRFDVGMGYEVWVGRNARQNDELTFHHARKFDRWLHARGVAGSHTVLRVPHRNAIPPRPVLERAAAIAAWFSKARTSGLAPVIVTERKHVRKARNGPPGAVIVEREEVLLVEPSNPGSE